MAPEDVTSPSARRTIAILRDLCSERGMDPDPYIRKLCDGFSRYGEESHLAPGFDLAEEWRQEAQDVVAFASVAVSRGMVERDDPALAVYMQAARRLVTALGVLAGGEQREPDKSPDWDTYGECRNDCLTCDR